MNKLRVGVTGTGSLIGQAVIKSIRRGSLRDEVRLVGMDFFPDTAGAQWVDAHHRLPDLLDRALPESEWIARVEEIIAAERLEFLFIGVDFELRAFAAHRDRIAAATGCRVVVSDPEVIEVARDKFRTYRFLVENDLDAPATWVVKNGERCPIPFPCVVKPRVGQRSRGVSIVGSEEALWAACAAIADPIAQELIGDPSVEYTCGVICLDGEVRTVISLRRELKDGNTWIAYYDGEHPVVDGYVRRAAALLRPWGACNFQLRIGRDGRPRIFEINARHSGTTYMRALFGCNEVDYILRSLTGRPVEPFRPRPGRVIRFVDELFIPAS